MAIAKPVSKEKLDDYCRSNGIKWLATHDAEVVRRNFPDVDLFLLVEFEETRTVGYIELYDLQEGLSLLFGGPKADLRTTTELREQYRDEVLDAAEVHFAA